MIYVIETMFGGDNHLMVNSSMVEILSAEGKNRIILYGNPVQGNKIKALCAKADITLRKVKVQGNPPLYLLPVYVIYQLWLYTRLFIKSARGRHAVVITCIFPVTHYLLKIVKKVFPRVRLLVVLHGEVEFMRDNKKRILRLLGFFLRQAFRMRCDARTRYLVFGESIRKNMIAQGYVHESEIIAIDHPYNYEVQFSVQQQTMAATPVFGSVGVASPQKNSQLIFDLALRLKSLVKQGKIVMKIVGALEAGVEEKANELVIYDKRKIFLERAEYEQRIMALDYILFFYDNSYYKFTASGAFFDTVKFEKPVIALRNDYLDHYFEKLGNIGYLCNNLDEMAAHVSEIAQGRRLPEYEAQKRQMQRAKETLSVATIGSDFWFKASYLIP